MINKIPNPNYSPTKPKGFGFRIKCGVLYKVSIGTMTQNPEKYAIKPSPYPPKYWIWFENYWYLIKQPVPDSIGEIIEFIEKDCYCKDHVIDKIISLI